MLLVTKELDDVDAPGSRAVSLDEPNYPPDLYGEAAIFALKGSLLLGVLVVVVSRIEQ